MAGKLFFPTKVMDMAYDKDLARRVSAVLVGTPNLAEKAMFGGIGYLVNGNMACGVYQDFLIVRVGPERYQSTLKKPGVKVLDITGRPMTGWVMVASDAIRTESGLESWVGKGLDYALTLPSK
jgi:TfoX/Sxy family transcriptional regulator of competence genes